MKKNLKITAAAAAAAVILSGMTFSSGAQQPDAGTAYAALANESSEEMVGGWTLDFSKVAPKNVPEAKAAFVKATAGIKDKKYKAVAVLGRQLVAGMNYCILCTEDSGSGRSVRLMYIYADLSGNAEITGFKTIIGDALPGGFTANTGKLGINNNAKALKIFNAAVKGYTEYTFKPYAYLGSQVVAGKNHLYLCRGKGNYPGAKNEWYLVTVYQSPDGKNGIINVGNAEVGTMDDIGEEQDNNGFVGMANPWQEYGTAAEAAKAAGVGSFDAPESLGRYSTVYIQAMKGIAEIRWSDGKKEIIARKGAGTDDISGDYNEYSSVITGKISGVKVTVRGDGKKFFNISWTDGKYSYCYLVRDGMSKKTAVSHVKAIIGK